MDLVERIKRIGETIRHAGMVVLDGGAQGARRALSGVKWALSGDEPDYGMDADPVRRYQLQEHQRLQDLYRRDVADTPTDQMVLSYTQDGVGQNKRVWVYLTEGSWEKMNGVRMERGGQITGFWEVSYSIPHQDNPSRVWHPHIAGKVFDVTLDDVVHWGNGIHVHRGPLAQPDKDYLTDRLMIKCGTRTRFVWGGNRQYFLHPDPGLIAEVEGFQQGDKLCNLLGTSALQLVNPPELERDRNLGWFISYLCRNHAEQYSSRLLREIVPEVNVPATLIPPGRAGESQRYGYTERAHLAQGRRILNIDHQVFPSKLHVRYDFRNVQLTIVMNSMVAGWDRAAIADLSQTWY